MLDQYAWITLVCRLQLILSSIEQKRVHGACFHFYCLFAFWSVRETLALKLYFWLKFNRSISLAIFSSLSFCFVLILSMIVVNCILNFLLGAYILFIYSLNHHLPSLLVVRMAHSIQEFISLNAINQCLSRDAHCRGCRFSVVHNIFFSKHLTSTYLCQSDFLIIHRSRPDVLMTW